MVIFSAPWVIPIDKPVIADGAIVTANGRIVEVGRRQEILETFPDLREISNRCVLMPGLVNCHMHLELSYLGKSIKCLENQKFTDWINKLLELRSSTQTTRQTITDSFLSAVRAQLEAGVSLIGDIGNDPLPELEEYCAEVDSDTCPEILRMIEYLAPNRNVSLQVLESVSQQKDNFRLTAHAPYSTGPEVLVAIKKRCNRLGHVFSVHTDESPDEAQFIQSGTGIFREFLEERKSWDGLFPFATSSFSGTIEYFDRLGILDENTLLIHCTHLLEDDLHLVKKRGSAVCLCPGSNRFLGVGQAPVEKMLEVGLLPGLGTDSIGSNQILDIWQEMQLLASDLPLISPEKILAMATEGGARGLGCYDRYGSLAAGKDAKIIHVASEGLDACKTEEALLQELVTAGKPAVVSWLETFQE